MSSSTSRLRSGFPATPAAVARQHNNHRTKKVDDRQLFDEVSPSLFFDDGVRIVRFVHGKPGAQATFLDRFRIALEDKTGHRIDWSPFPPVARPCLPGKTKVVWNWGNKELAVILSREEAFRYFATCRPMYRSASTQLLPTTEPNRSLNSREEAALGTLAINSPQGAADARGHHDPTVQTPQTHHTDTQTAGQNNEEAEMYWCIDKVFVEPIKTVFRRIGRVEHITEDSSFYRLVNLKLQSAEGTGVKGWILHHASWKRVTEVEFIKFLIHQDDWVKREKVDLPLPDDGYVHGVDISGDSKMEFLAEELVAGLHDPEGAASGSRMVNTLPRRRYPPPLPTLRGTQAWGLYAKKGFSAGRIIFWFGSSIIFLVAFAAIWLATIDGTDVQTALAPGTVIVTILTLMLGILQTLNQ